MVFINLKDKTLFGNEAGEDEDLDLLNSYYIDHEDFEDFFNKDVRLNIVSARKGMGKSALLSRLEFKLKNDDIYSSPIIIRVKGNDLLGLGDFVDKDQAYLENYWKQIICKKVILEIGNSIGFALTSDEMSIIEIAELEGIKSKNIVGGLISRIKGKIPLVGTELKNTIPNNLESLLNNYQEKNDNSKVWILIDDIDAKFQNNDKYQSRVGSFFSAIRALAFGLNNLNIRATVRSDVWSCLRHLEDLDKMEQYIIDIFWSKRHMRDILANKILAYIKRTSPESDEAKFKLKSDYNKLLDLVFKSPIIWRNNSDVKLFEAISAFSNRRPRWMAQLCRMAASKAKSNPNARKIDLEHINNILEEFGKNRKNDLIKEHQHQFDELSILIDAFRATDKEFKYSNINKILQDNFIKERKVDEIPNVDGSKYCNPEDFGNFIYKLGLISRVHDDGKKFTHFSDDPDLYRSIENRNDNITWSIHPSYRTFLNIR
ncbi:MAG: hypothetical protein Q8Q45_08485 [Methylococcaceae bacterium]|nr:hypothetical protein [Methylococcaceae bacterium]MDP3388407.1 hypothetical protein [Methylococcaceae bacterium]MDP3932374.1 hypothetical protein [Methylococcaceae bacterium]MDZ4157230.1 hypothetical protein [Methylococcales bacterium]